ncbi:uncharacterized protein LOC130387618 isoform X3 [Gadus chalcogrammus]|uniref:uncharacterized protein LOC130387618 isoform X3 n=2 Tax=Gadus chalcogrammus TaxID=1042646 RepID=UPI0024C4CEEE|nr:uncharacterized protein LOC130387618 isoform X3 [Gadus chalcogrammus]
MCMHVLLHTDMDYPPHSLGALLPHHHPIVDHSRSRYRGQPPSQPYYLFQWNLNPYHRYGQALSALPCVRPHMARRPNMYPGYGTSQAIGCPADYKRGFNSHSSSPVAPGFHRGYARKMGMSADQRDPRDPLCKLVERLDRLSTKEEENGDGEEEYLPKAPPPGRGTPWYPGMGELKETGVNPQEHRPLREQGPWALKAGPRPPQSQAVSGIQGAFPLDSSSANEEEEEPLCLVGAGHPSVWSSSIDGQSSGEDVGPADVSESALNLNTNQAVSTGGGRTTTERNAAVCRSLEDGGKEICVPLSASQSESPEADPDVCACCGASLEEEDDCPGDPGEHLHGSPFEAAHAGMACSFVEEMATNDMRDGAEMMGSCLMPGQLVQHHYWYPCVCPPNPHALPPLGPRHPTRRLWNRAAGQCPCGELEGAPRTIHDPKGNRGYERAPHDWPPSGLRSKAKDHKQKKQRGGAQHRSYEDSWGNGCSKYRPWSSRPYRGPDDQGSLQNERPSWESFSRNMPWRADRQYKEAPDSPYCRGRGNTMLCTEGPLKEEALDNKYWPWPIITLLPNILPNSMGMSRFNMQRVLGETMVLMVDFDKG